MKNLFVMPMLLLCVTLCGCDAISKAISERPGALKEEAAKQVREYSKLTELGGSSFLCETREAPTPVPTKVFELRNARMLVSPTTLSEADKLNGVEWKGSVYINADAFRVRNGNAAGWVSDRYEKEDSPRVHDTTLLVLPYDGHYTDEFRVTRTKGEWKVTPCNTVMDALVRNYHVTFKHVEPSDLPK
jgi:hypothetical protein